MTNEPMTEQELREIEGLAAAATDGEWRAVDKGNTVPSHAVMYYGIGVKPVNIASGISPSTGNAAFIAVSRLAVPQMAAEIRRAWDENEKTMGELRRARKFGDDLAHLMSAAIRQREKAKDELRKQISHTIRARRLRDALTVENKRLRALLHKIYNVADEERFLEVTAVIDAENGGTHE